MIPKEVFHYTTNCSALKILTGKQLRLGQYGYTNDPRETKERLFLPTFDTTNYDYEIGNRIFQEINKIIHNEWKILCVTTNHPKLEAAKSEQEKKEIREANPFLSGNARPRMWAQYAENHQGVCMKLNGEKLDQKIAEQLEETSTIFCRSTDYSDR